MSEPVPSQSLPEPTPSGTTPFESLTSGEIVGRFTAFHVDRGHHLLPSAPLLTGDDDPVLFTTSGMHPLTPYLERGHHPAGPRLVSVQRCLRTTDVEEVGDATHLTSFRMLGVWSVGDYTHAQSLRLGYELVTGVLGVPHRLLHVTCFGGEDDVPRDDAAVAVWTGLGVPVEEATDENWWSNGPGGLCGPDSEIFVWTGPPDDVRGTPTTDGRWVEIGNHVSMRFDRTPDGLVPLRTPCVDVGLGLERLAMVLQGAQTVYGTDGLRPWIDGLGPWGLSEEDLRVTTDHLRSCLLLLGEGLRPGHRRQGYVLKRLLRRVLTRLWLTDRTLRLGDLPGELVRRTADEGGLPLDVAEVRDVLDGHQRGFEQVLRRGERVLRQHLRDGAPDGALDPGVRTMLADTYGLPGEVTDLLVGRARDGAPASAQPDGRALSGRSG